MRSDAIPLPGVCPESRRYVCSSGGDSTRNCKHMGRQSPWTGRQGHGVSAAGKKSPQTGQPPVPRAPQPRHTGTFFIWNEHLLTMMFAMTGTFQTTLTKDSTNPKILLMTGLL